jgi:hypothetical protein
MARALPVLKPSDGRICSGTSKDRANSRLRIDCVPIIAQLGQTIVPLRQRYRLLRPAHVHLRTTDSSTRATDAHLVSPAMHLLASDRVRVVTRVHLASRGAHPVPHASAALEHRACTARHGSSTLGSTNAHRSTTRHHLRAKASCNIATGPCTTDQQHAPTDRESVDRLQRVGRRGHGIAPMDRRSAPRDPAIAPAGQRQWHQRARHRHRRARRSARTTNTLHRAYRSTAPNIWRVHCCARATRRQSAVIRPFEKV